MPGVLKAAACGGADVADWVRQLACPLGPIPLAARGLAAVLARAGSGGRAGSLRRRRLWDRPWRPAPRGPGPWVRPMRPWGSALAVDFEVAEPDVGWVAEHVAE
jgi:hypothetical protein